jgi:chromosomal replication initiation ATPase DnaA
MNKEIIKNALSPHCSNEYDLNQATEKIMKMFNVGNINLKIVKQNYDHVLPECQKVLAPYITFSIKRVRSRSRKAEVIFHRAIIAHFLYRKKYNKKLIGQILGGRTHATVICSLKYNPNKSGHNKDYPKVIAQMNKELF